MEIEHHLAIRVAQRARSGDRILPTEGLAGPRPNPRDHPEVSRIIQSQTRSSAAPAVFNHFEVPTIQPLSRSSGPRDIPEHPMPQAPMRTYEGTLFAPGDAAYLESCGWLAEGRTPGFRILHKRMLSSTSHAAYSDTSLDIRATDIPRDHNAFEEVPLELVSPETLKYVGFTAWRADELWERFNRSSHAWRLRPPRFKGDEEALAKGFVDFMLGVVNSAPDTRRGVDGDDDGQWRRCLALMGINSERQAAIMEPEYREVRRSRTCIYWVEDTIKWRFGKLVEMGRCSRERDERMREFARVPELGRLRNLDYGGDLMSVDGHGSSGLAAGEVGQDAAGEVLRPSGDVL